MNAITFTNSVPLIVRGNNSNALALPDELADSFGVDRSNPYDRRMFDAAAAFSSGPQLSPWGDKIAANAKMAMDSAQLLAPQFAGITPAGFERQMLIAARLINAGLGIKVINLTLGNFDTHADQPATHAALLTQLDNGIGTFFNTLSDSARPNVTLMTYSEFGRRPYVNGSNGTDHGTATDVWLLGDRVRGGFDGEAPSLTTLDRDGNLIGSVDFRSVLTSVIDDLLGADARQIIGADYPKLDLFTDATGPGYWMVETNGKVTSFGGAPNLGSPPRGTPIVAMAAHPQRTGYWLAAPDGAVFAYGTANYAGGMNGRALASPIVSLAATNTGNGYWLLGRDGGIFSFGDAEFYGSTGAISLNQPIVSMQTTSTGRGYWMVASDGGLFAFGDATFRGSLANKNRTVAAMGG
jgi:hypothetical protein